MQASTRETAKSDSGIAPGDLGLWLLLHVILPYSDRGLVEVTSGSGARIAVGHCEENVFSVLEAILINRTINLSLLHIGNTRPSYILDVTSHTDTNCNISVGKHITP